MKKTVVAATGTIIGGLVIAGLVFQNDSDYSWGTEGNSSSNGWPQQQQTSDYQNELEKSKETNIIQTINNIINKNCDCSCEPELEPEQKMWKQWITGTK